MQKFTKILIGSALLVAAASTNLFAQRITVTVAGTGIAGCSGDGGSSKQAQISGPKDICLDAAQNIYFVDRGNGRIRKISAIKGIITTVAGGGASTADGVPATNASLTMNYMCISASGNIYFTTDDNRIRKISSGIVTTVAGTGAAGYSGDGGLALAATLNNPQGICIDAANNIYFVDRNNNCIRTITASTGNISTIAGNGTPGLAGDGGPAVSALLNAPVCICVSPIGDIYFSDQNPNYPSYDNSIIRKIEASTGLVTHIIGSLSGTYTHDVPSLTAIMGTTTGLCFSPSGKIYCNEMSCSNREHDFATDSLYLVAGDFSIQGYSDDIRSPLANMNIPYGLCVDLHETVYVADSNNQRIRKIIKLTNTPTFAFGRGQFMEPVIGTPFSLDSMLWITDLDLGQNETWTVVTPPAHGVLSGFPATNTSNGDNTTTKPSGLTYSASSGYSGSDLFRIRVSDDGGLSDTVTVYVGPNSTGVTLEANSMVVATAINIFPNPASNVLNVEWTNLKNGATDVVIADITDKVFFTTKIAAGRTTGSTQFDISAIPAGVYFVKMNGVEMKKFVKE